MKRGILFILLMGCLSMVNAQTDTTYNIEDEIVYTDVDISPSFKGGEKGLIKFIYSQLQFVRDENGKLVRGVVELTFVVRSDGLVKEVSVLQSDDPRLNEEAIRVVSLLPNWTPGVLEGKKVNTVRHIKVRFG